MEVKKAKCVRKDSDFTRALAMLGSQPLSMLKALHQVSQARTHLLDSRYDFEEAFNTLTEKQHALMTCESQEEVDEEYDSLMRRIANLKRVLSMQTVAAKAIYVARFDLPKKRGY